VHKNQVLGVVHKAHTEVCYLDQPRT